MAQVDVKEAQSHLSELIDAAMNGESVVIAKNAQAKVKLVPLNGDKPRPLFGSAQGSITLAADFDEPLSDFEPYTK